MATDTTANAGKTKTNSMVQSSFKILLPEIPVLKLAKSEFETYVHALLNKGTKAGEDGETTLLVDTTNLPVREKLQQGEAEVEEPAADVKSDSPV